MSDAPDLTGRLARCSCGKTNPSDKAAPGYKDLPFFEFRGEGSSSAALCKCGYAEVAHGCERDLKQRFTCGAYEPRGAWEFDGFYCGHAGWD
jgi:hypothetical protein